MTIQKSAHDENPNITWARLFVDELIRGGLAAVCISPGSRSTPLALAFFANDNIKVYRHLDERSAAFFALGVALATENPVALVCTSGTAAANYYPAIVEAKMSQVPLLILTADRPHELRQSGANQTIDQVKMFGDHVLWSIDIALPQFNTPPQAFANLRSLAARALARSNGFTKGPVHMNFPFRKPLEPEKLLTSPSLAKLGEQHQPLTTIDHGVIQPTAKQLDFLAKLINEHPRGIIVCGPRCPGGDFPAAVAKLAKIAGYPILADPLSGVRFGDSHADAAIIGSYESFLQVKLEARPAPELILRFGSVPTSNWLNQYLHQVNSHTHIHIHESGTWADQDHSTTHLFQLNPSQLCHRLYPAIDRLVDEKWTKQWTRLESTTWAVINNHISEMTFDGSAVAALINLLPPDTALFSGNSLAIRHVDQFGQPLQKALTIFANRGASGIDGNLSTGLGIAAARSRPTVLLVGDITFYHDSNGLLALNQLDQGKVIIVLLNNNGGGIFRRLPVARFEPPFEELFLTPHDLDFSHIAAMYGLRHHVTGEISDFRAIFEATFADESSSIIEFRSNGKNDERLRQQIITAVQSQLSSL